MDLILFHSRSIMKNEQYQVLEKTMLVFFLSMGFTRRIGLTKIYQKGTGNPAENLGHTVTIQFEWNFRKRRFEGKWYVKTNKYSGNNKFRLKFQQ